MAIKTKFKDIEFGVGDRIRVVQKVTEGDKQRKQAFEGMVIGIKGRGETKSFTVRRIGAQQVGIERIFPVNAPTIESVEVLKKGQRGARRAKLYYTRDKAKKEIDEIYSRTVKREKAKEETPKATRKKKRASKK
jgi:large subunit ribosomal protein L19